MSVNKQAVLTLAETVTWPLLSQSPPTQGNSPKGNHTNKGRDGLLVSLVRINRGKLLDGGTVYTTTKKSNFLCSLVVNFWKRCRSRLRVNVQKWEFVKNNDVMPTCIKYSVYRHVFQSFKATCETVNATMMDYRTVAYDYHVIFNQRYLYKWG